MQTRGEIPDHKNQIHKQTMKMHKRMHGGFTLVELLVVIVIIAALAGLAAPQIMKQRKKADQSEAVSNARQIGLALFEFETDYGSFPDRTTAQAVQDNTGTSLSLAGTSANDYFRQLLAAEIATSEEIFYAKTAFSKKKPDNVFNTSSKALEAGEVGFGYIMNQQNALNSSGNPSRPVAAAPLAFPFQSARFDSDFYDSRAVVLRIDNSVQSLRIMNTTKLAMLGGGKNLLQTGDDTIWGTDMQPTMVHPQAKR
jgi:prepilin-type N-terminal cleavage/methylation domain-containing protein